LPPSRADLLSGNGAPSAELGNNGYHYLDAQTSKLYKKVSDSWSVLITRFAIKGDKAIAAKPAHVEPAGPVGPNGPGLRAFANPAALAAAATLVETRRYRNYWKNCATLCAQSSKRSCEKKSAKS
jgi:hypothetical protein